MALAVTLQSPITVQSPTVIQFVAAVAIGTNLSLEQTFMDAKIKSWHDFPELVLSHHVARFGGLGCVVHMVPVGCGRKGR